MVKKKILLILLPSALIVFLIWLPFGFALTGLIEEWGALGIFTRSGLFWLALPSSPLAAHALRPLTSFPHALSYFLDPNSFKYWHILLMLSLILKGFSISYIFMKITGSYRWSAVVGMLALVYPADTMQLSFRSFHINISLALVLLSCVFFINATDQIKKILSYFMLFCGAILFFLACCLYEAALVFLPFPILMLFVKGESFKKILNRWKFFLIWSLGAFGYILYVILSSRMIPGTSYQASIVTEGNPLVQIIVNLPKLFSIGVVRSLLDGWLFSFRVFFTEFNNYSYFFIIFILLAIFLYFLSRVDKKQFYQENSSLLLYRWMIVGFVLILFGYSPFLLLHWHQGVSQRTFLFAAPGAAFFLTAILAFLSRKFLLFANFISIIFILFGLGTQFYQFYYYTQISYTQRAILKEIAEKFDGNIDKNKTIILIDKSNQLGYQWTFPSDLMPNLLSYLYGREINNPVQICHWPSGEWMQVSDDGRKGRCVEEGNQWRFFYPVKVQGPGYTPKIMQEDLLVPKKDVFTIVIDLDLSKKYPIPARLSENKFIVSRRYNGFITSEPWFLDVKLFKNSKMQDSYEWSFGKWWSLEVPIRGVGWRGVEWTVNKFSQYSAAWKILERASIDFDLSPKNQVNYILEGYFDYIVNDDIKEKLKMFLNKKEVKYIWTSQGYFKAEVQSKILVNGVNEILFDSPIALDFYGLSAKLSWFKIYPKIGMQD